MIPTVVHRSVPATTSAEVEAFWEQACAMHPGWETHTWRDPIDPVLFPLTSPHWHRCTTGAQLAGLVRLEALWHYGGFYLDSDFEPWRPLDPLLGVDMVAGYEDPGVIPDAVLGARPGHPAVHACLTLAVERLVAGGTDWATGGGAWATGPGVTTRILPGRSDVLLLPPGAFYPLHYSLKAAADWERVRAENPWAFGAHRWHASWL